MKSFWIGVLVVVGTILVATYAAVSLGPEVFSPHARLEGISDLNGAEGRHLATPIQVEAGERSAGTLAPDFQAPASDGTTYRLSEVVKERPAVLIFIKADCPCSRSADPYFQRIHTAGRGWVPFFGVIDGDVAVARKWIDQTGAVFPILADPERKIVHDFGAENSAYVAFVSPGGRIEKLWAGYSQTMLSELAQLMARWVKSELDSLDVTDAPKDLYTGCPY